MTSAMVSRLGLSLSRNYGNSARTWTNPFNYGAEGDGVADDTAAIQAAINEVENKGGGVVYIPPGLYRHSGLTINSNNVALIGDSRSSCKLIYTRTTGNDITVGAVDADIDGIYIESLWLAQESTAVRTAGSKIYGYNLDQCALRDLYITDWWTGISMEAIARSEITDIWFRIEHRLAPPANPKVDYAFDLMHNTTTDKSIVGLKMTRCVATVTSGLHEGFIKINTCDWLLVDQCHDNNANVGVLINHDNSFLDFWMTNTYLDASTDTDVLIQGSSSEDFDNLVFDNVYFRVPQDRCVSIENSGSSTLESIIFNNCRFTGSVNDAIYMANENTDELIIRNNRFDNCCTTGGNVIDSKAVRTMITNNNFPNSDGSYLINVARAASSGVLQVVGNEFIGGSPSTSDINHTNIAIIKIEGNTGQPDEFQPKYDNHGLINITTDANGQATIAHGLAQTPTWASAERNGDNAEEACIVTLDATNITVRVRNSTTNADIASAARNIWWRAKV